jgi:predicted transcriptional regulator
MATLTIRLPDDTHARLKALAKRRRISVNKLMEELSSIALAEFDAETRFIALAVRGSREQGLALLETLDQREAQQLSGSDAPPPGAGP